MVHSAVIAGAAVGALIARRKHLRLSWESVKGFCWWFLGYLPFMYFVEILCGLDTPATNAPLFWGVVFLSFIGFSVIVLSIYAALGVYLEEKRGEF